MLGPVPQEGEPRPAYLSQADQRIRHDLTQMVARQFMPAGVESSEAGRVWLSQENTVTKTWSQFTAGGLHLCLAALAEGYLRQGDSALGLRALELAAEALRSADKADPALSSANPENHHNAARILARLAYLYEQQGRPGLAQALSDEAYGWAPELFGDESEHEQASAEDEMRKRSDCADRRSDEYVVFHCRPSRGSRAPVHLARCRIDAPLSPEKARELGSSDRHGSAG